MADLTNPGGAIPELQKAKAMDAPAFVSALLPTLKEPPAIGLARWPKWRTSRKDLKRSLPGQPPPFNLALMYIGLGDHQRALDSLELAYAADSQWMGWLKNDHIFDSLRSEPRFKALLRKLQFDT